MAVLDLIDKGAKLAADSKSNLFRPAQNRRL
jgi:hypothetical protein